MKPAALIGDTDDLYAPPQDASARKGFTLANAAVILAFLAYVAVVGGGWWLALQIVPSHVSITVLGHRLDTDSAHEHLNNIALIFVLLPSALWIEAAIVGWRQSSARQLVFAPTPSLKTDIACFVFGQAYVIDIAGRVMMLGASMISGAFIHTWLEARTGLAIGPPALPLPLLVVAYFYVYSFFDYWTHRTDHTRFFWPIHRYHHSAEDFGVITSGRQHAVHLTAIFLVNLPLAILGAPTEVMIYVNVLVVGLGFLIHSKINADWGFIGRWLVQSPNHHRAHHKLDMGRPTGHFAIAPVWDRLFGTWYEDKPDPKLAIGVDTPYAHGWFFPRDMLRDYLHFWIGFVGGRSDGPKSDLKLPRLRRAETRA